MRTLTSIAMTAALALVLGASQASAISSIKLIYLGGASGGITGPNTVDALDSDTVRFAIVICVDSLGYTASAFDLRWDADGENELDLVNLRMRPSVNLLVDPGPPPTLLNYAVFPLTSTQESTTAGDQGEAYGWDSTATSVSPPFPASVSFRVGVVEFHVNNPNNNAGPDLEIGYYRVSGPGFGDKDFNNITPNFGSFQIDSVPEAGTSLLMGMGVLGLILAGRASRKS